MLKLVIGVPWYIRNSQIHWDLKMEAIAEFFRDRAVKRFNNLQHHPNPLVRDTVEEYNEEAVLKHKWPRVVLQEDQKE